MRQVPRYLLIGGGRLASHFHHYFTLLGLNSTSWHRTQPLTQLNEQLALATHVLVLIKDDVLEAFYHAHLTHSPALLIHCSGSHISPHMHGAHPLMTFQRDLYDLAHYQTIPFVIDADAPAFHDLLPGLPNAHVRLDQQLKAKYHALCVLSGNFTCLLWQKFFSSLEQEFNLPAAIAFPYLEQQTKNLMHDAKSALTGPLVRQDQQTLQKNLTALTSDPFQKVYASFIQAYSELNEEH